jgi:acetyl esterase/lipase
LSIVIVGLLLLGFSSAVQAAEVFEIWPDGAPGALGSEAKDKPTLRVMLPKRVGEGPMPAVLMTPGGGYKHHSSAGPLAQFCLDRGIAVFYLKYRLPTAGYQHPAPWNDAQRAMRILRTDHKKWNLDTKRIGVIGFSSGGHVGSTLATHATDGNAESKDPIERSHCRPDFGIFFCPVISMKSHPHRPSVVRLLGSTPDAKLIDKLSNELQVTAQTPPIYLAHAADDRLVPPENSKMLHAALKKQNIPTRFDLYESGNHGFFGASENAKLWQDNLQQWLIEMKVIARE